MPCDFWSWVIKAMQIPLGTQEHWAAMKGPATRGGRHAGGATWEALWPSVPAEPSLLPIPAQVPAPDAEVSPGSGSPDWHHTDTSPSHCIQIPDPQNPWFILMHNKVFLGVGGQINWETRTDIYTLLLLLSRSVMSDSVRPHRRQPTRLHRPWDSPGKNTGVGCHFLLQCMKVKSEREAAQLCPTPSDPMDCSPPDFSIHGILQARALEWGATALSDIHTTTYKIDK